jgi:hypothetical protein
MRASGFDIRNEKKRPFDFARPKHQPTLAAKRFQFTCHVWLFLDYLRGPSAHIAPMPPFNRLTKLIFPIPHGETEASSSRQRLTCASPMTSYFEPSSYLATRNVAAMHMVEDLQDIAGFFARGLSTAEAGPASQSP